jgi:hypothetical protein
MIGDYATFLRLSIQGDRHERRSELARARALIVEARKALNDRNADSALFYLGLANGTRARAHDYSASIRKSRERLGDLAPVAEVRP